MEPYNMTKGEALQKFFSGFGIAAYTATSVPEDAIFPWLTYDAKHHHGVRAR